MKLESTPKPVSNASQVTPQPAKKAPFAVKTGLKSGDVTQGNGSTYP